MLIAYELGFHSHFWNVIHRNPSRNLPYHNNQHCFTVAYRSFEGAKALGLPEREQRKLFLAGLYHDWDHTGTSNEDDNIGRALVGVLDSAERYGTVLNTFGMIEVTQLIEATDSTKNDDTQTFTVSEQIIRDADLLQWCEPDYQLFLDGLSKEFGFPVTVESTKEFLMHATIHTKYAKNLLEASPFS